MANPNDPYFQDKTGVAPAASDVGSGGGSASASGGIGGVGTNTLTGFASRYNPDQLQNIYSTPWAVLPDVFPGMNMSGAGYQGLRDIGGDPLTLYNIMAGGKNDLSNAGVGGYANWLNSLYQSLGSKGGRQFTARELIDQIFNPGRGEGNGGAAGSKDSALYNIETTGDAATQMRTLFNMLRDASNVGMNPLAARGYQGSVARAGDEAINKMMNQGSGTGANNKSVYQLIRDLNPSLVP